MIRNSGEVKRKKKNIRRKGFVKNKKNCQLVFLFLFNSFNLNNICFLQGHACK